MEQKNFFSDNILKLFLMILCLVLFFALWKSDYSAFKGFRGLVIAKGAEAKTQNWRKKIFRNEADFGGYYYAVISDNGKNFRYYLTDLLYKEITVGDSVVHKRFSLSATVIKNSTNHNPN